MLIHQQLQERGNGGQADKLCLVYGDVRLTYGEFMGQTDCLARRLAMRIKKGDRVLVKRGNPLEQLLYFFAVVKAGGVCVLIDPSTTAEVIAKIMTRHTLDWYIDEQFVPPAAQAPLPDLRPQELFLGALSSGSTGIPKLIWRDHQSWTGMFAAQSRVFGVSCSDTLYLAGSLVYTGNLNACLHMLAEGGTVVMAAGAMPRTWLREIAACQVTAIFMVPANYRRLLQILPGPLTRITAMSSVGAKLDRHTVERLLRFFPQARIVEYYGASELGHVSYLTAAESLCHPGAVGKAFPGVTITVEDGVIWVESPCLAPDYRPKASVGDLGRLDQDGYLYLLGRKQGLINSGGVKVIPEQVEAVLLQCPGIAEAVVSGIDDRIRGQKVCAWLVRNTEQVQTKDILAFCRKHMLKACCPQKLVFVDAMPLTASGKIDRARLAAGETPAEV